MPNIFDLDQKGRQALAARARDNPFDPAQLPLPVWAGFGDQFKSLLRPSASAVRTLTMAGAPVAMLADKAAEAGDWIGSFGRERQPWDPGPGRTNYSDLYFKTAVDNWAQNVVDYWTPDARSSGSAARTMGTIFNVLGSIPQIAGTPELFLADAALAPGIDTTRAGGSTRASLEMTAASLGANAIGMGLPPAFGATLATRVATGAGANVVVGAAQNAASAGILRDDGLGEMAASYDWKNPQALMLDALMGGAFGLAAHIDANDSPLVPSQRDAILAGNNANHFANKNLPGAPRTPEAGVHHQDALESALRQMSDGDQVEVGSHVDLSQFELRPELQAHMQLRGGNEPQDVQHDFRTLAARHDATITSMERPIIAAGAGARSQHPHGTAADFRTRDKTPEQVEALMADLRAAGFEVIDERHTEAPHVHAELPPGGRRSLQRAAGQQAQLDYDSFRVALESGGDPNAAASGSSALGRDQFTADTWRGIVAHAKPAWAEGLSDAELLDARRDPAKSAEMELALRAENTASLERAGQDATPINLYAMHHFGGRGVEFARAAGDTPIDRILTAEQINANPYLRGMTKDEVIANWLDRARRAGVMLADELDAPNFGLPEAPRTIADEDPFWQSIPDGVAGRETWNIQTPEREALRAQLVDEHFTGKAEAPVGRKPIAYVMGGGGASGKGTVLAALQEAGEVPRGLVHIDPDAIKTGEHGISGIPEYAAMIGRGDGRAAAVTHEESSKIAGRAKDRAIAEKRDFVLDRTLGDSAKAIDELHKLKDAGYEVRLYGVTLDPSEAVRRAVKRAQGKNRWVPMPSLLRAHKGFAGGFSDYAKVVDRAFLFDNGGETHRLLAKSDGAGGLKITDERAYNDFRGRSSINDQATTHRGIRTARPAGESHAGAMAEGSRGQGHVGARGSSPERIQAGNRGTGAHEGEAGLSGDSAAQRSGAPETNLDAVARIAQEGPDMMVLDGFDADGNPRYRPVAAVLAEIEAERARAEADASAFTAAANCFLRRGGNAS